MEIVVHVTDGEVFRFEQEDPALINAIFHGVQPARIFQQKQILVHGRLAVSGFASSAIEQVEFITDVEPNWTAHQAVADSMVSVSEEKFQDGVTKLLRSMGGQRPELRPGEKSRGFAEFVMTSGKRIYVVFEVTVKNKLEQRQILNNFLNPGGFYCRRQDGGHVIVNTENISRFTLNPGPNDAIANAWVATRKAESLSARMSMEQVNLRDL